MNVPLQRRFETMAVLWFTTAIAIFLSIFWFLCAIPLFWPILIPYLIYILRATVHEDGSPTYTRSNFMRRLPVFKFYKNYFPLSLHRTVPLDASKNYIFGYHPHGIISHGAFGSFAVEEDSQGGAFARLFPGIRNTLLTLDSNFRIPGYREYLLSLGLASVSRRSCENILRGINSPIARPNPPTSGRFNIRSILLAPLTFPVHVLTTIGILRPSYPVHTQANPAPELNGRAITIVIGGAAESLYAHPGTLNLILHRRRGFLKLALRENALLVPVLGFGENDIYEQLTPSKGSIIHKIQQAVKRAVGFTMPLFHARGVFNYDVGVLPYRRDINVVVGKPVGLPGQGEEGGHREATDDEVRELMDLYIAELKRMWDAHKDEFAKNRKEGPEGEMVLLE
ncbi:diacylglycerol acyltransferase [Ascobolus immersus RN42]|uniref:Diacylglycerol O-acyltransferase n=1 Tax=Ascobolus immersus RN42 TaxID=1160509 RepID=A0A3N4IKG7_ASCIM|nr:diacylglycerol acyltransferase [Ascobolus immersus RN42]